jgi:hypothetical protein
MRKLLVSVLTLCTAVLAVAETDTGIVYGYDNDIFILHQNTVRGILDLWVAGSPTGFILGHFSFTEDPLLGGKIVFTATKGISFKGYKDRFFGNVADMWLEGLFDSQVGYGRPMIARCCLTDPLRDAQNYFAIEIFDPRDLSKPVYTRVGLATNTTHVLIKNDAGGLADGQGWSDVGLATSKGFDGGYWGIENVTASFRAYSNGLFSFELETSRKVGLVGKRLRSFHCTNNTILGKAAEFWFDACIGSSVKTAYTPVVVRVMVTQASLTINHDFMYVAVYDRTDLTKPIFERLYLSGYGRNKILCK